MTDLLERPPVTEERHIRVPITLVRSDWCGPYELAVYVAVQYLADRNDYATAPANRIAWVAGCSTERTRQALATLVARGVLNVQRDPGNPSIYHFTR